MPQRNQTAYVLIVLGGTIALLMGACLLLPSDGGGPPTAAPEMQTVIAAYPELGSWEDRLTQQSQSKTQIVLAYPDLLTARFETPPPLEISDLTPTPALHLPTAITPASVSTPTPFLPTLIPILDPERLPTLFRTIRLDSVNGLADHELKRISGWEFGFRATRFDCEVGPYRWLDDEHLLAFPVTGQIEGYGIIGYTKPLVMRISADSFWMPATNDPTPGCDLPLWSESLRKLIITNDREVLVTTPEGKVVQRFEGGLPLYYSSYLSPSGKRLLTGLVWRDLETGQEVTLSNSGSEQSATGLFNPAWSADETRLFGCCFFYGDVNTAQLAKIELNGLELPGRDGPPIQSVWVIDDTQAMANIQFILNSAGGFRTVFPIFDPIHQSYTDFAAPLGFDRASRCEGPLVAPDRIHVWVSCVFPGEPNLPSRSMLVNVGTFDAVSLPSGFSLVAWSSDSRFVLLAPMKNPDTFDDYVLLSVQGGFVPIAADKIIAPTWASQGARLAFLNADGQKLITADLNAALTFQVTLPFRARQVLWSWQGVDLAAVAEDGSLWWVPDPATDRVEQLTPPLPDVRDVRWSPSGTRLAFVSGADLYVVTIKPD